MKLNFKNHLMKLFKNTKNSLVLLQQASSSEDLPMMERRRLHSTQLATSCLRDFDRYSGHMSTKQDPISLLSDSDLTSRIQRRWPQSKSWKWKNSSINEYHRISQSLSRIWIRKKLKQQEYRDHSGRNILTSWRSIRWSDEMVQYTPGSYVDDHMSRTREKCENSKLSKKNPVVQGWGGLRRC